MFSILCRLSINTVDVFSVRLVDSLIPESPTSKSPPQLEEKEHVAMTVVLIVIVSSFQFIYRQSRLWRWWRMSRLMTTLWFPRENLRLCFLLRNNVMFRMDGDFLGMRDWRNGNSFVPQTLRLPGNHNRLKSSWHICKNLNKYFVPWPCRYSRINQTSFVRTLHGRMRRFFVPNCWAKCAAFMPIQVEKCLCSIEAQTSGTRGASIIRMSTRTKHK